MKRTLYTLLVATLLATTSLVNAQQVQTLYFLENAPMRHIINPAFQPVSGFYLTVPEIGYTSAWVGNNAYTMHDFIFKDPTTGNTITPLHPNAAPDWLAKKPDLMMIDVDLHTNILSFGSRTRKNGYFHFGISEHITTGVNIGKQIFGINDLTSGVVGPFALGANALVYTEIALGYSHKINEKWTVGGQLKVLLGHAYMQTSIDNLAIETGYEQLRLVGGGVVNAATPFRLPDISGQINSLEDLGLSSLPINDYRQWIKPAG